MSQSLRPVHLRPDCLLTLEEVARVARQGATVTVDPELRLRVDASRNFVDSWIAEERIAYGINTGFGALANVRISHADIEELQRNLVRSHSCGVGELLPPDVVRAMLLLRAVALLQGYSGVRYTTIETLLAMLEADLLPLVPGQGSVGASGDLAPLSHLALGLMGEGEVFLRGERMPAALAFERCGLKPVTLIAKEGLALINGTQAMAALGSLALYDLSILLRTADIAAAMSLEALMGTDATLNSRLHEVRRQPGQMRTAANLRRMVASSPLIASHKDCEQVQDSYALRCIPQVHGAARDMAVYATEAIEREINAATDNPLVFVEQAQIVSGGNFHGAPVAMALDAVALAPIYLCNISERRTFRLLDPHASGLVPFLSRARKGLHSGLMIAQYAAAALTSENKVLAHPSSCDTIPTSAGQEDHVSMGMGSARKLARIVDHTAQVLGIELLCAAQALEFRNPPHFGPGTRTAYLAVRDEFPAVEEDRVLSGELQAAAELARSGRLVAAVEAVIGPLQA